MGNEEILSFLQTEYDKALVSSDVVKGLIQLKKTAGKYKKELNKKAYKLFMNGITDAIKEFDEEIKREKRLSNNPKKMLEEASWYEYI